MSQEKSSREKSREQKAPPTSSQMNPKSRAYSRPASRKIQIKLAALDCFLTNGYVATSIADIRKRSGATTGSIYHFFDNKSALAFELFNESIASWQDSTRRATHSNSPEQLVRASVLGLIDWALDEPGQFQFMDEIRALAPTHAELAQCAAALLEGQVQAETMFATLIDQQVVRPLPWSLAHALMLGPTYDFLRHASTAPFADEIVQSARTHLPDMAWQAVRA